MTDGRGQVIYSIGARVAGGGIGTTAHHAVRALDRRGMLLRLLCSSSAALEIPRRRVRAMGWPSRLMRKLAVYDRSGRLDGLHQVLYDRWAARHVEACGVFHAWGGFGLTSFDRADELGAVTVVERASAHPRFQARLLAEEHARWRLPFRPRPWALRRALDEIACADHVLIPSGFVRDTFRTEGDGEEKLIEIPFGVDTTRFRPAERTRSGGGFRVLFVGEVGVQKGVPDLLEAWRKLAWPDGELLLAGRVVPAIRSLISGYARLPGVRIRGYEARPELLYRRADVFALPSIQEGSALVTYEALASGLPVVTTRNAGSVVRDGCEGFVVPIRDAGALADRLERLRSEPRLRLEMGRAARRRAEEFSWECYGERLARTFAGLVRAGCGQSVMGEPLDQPA